MKCPVCSNESFSQTSVLKERLIEEWNLLPNEVEYINKQQGYFCRNCFCNLRSMTLADGIMKHYSFNGDFKKFSRSKFGRILRLLEINEAGGLHQTLSHFRNYTFAEYPFIDMQELPFSESSFDLIVHSDSLEHVMDSIKALSECYRILKNGGVLFYTIPIIYNRLTKSRAYMKPSYHGSQDENQGEDYRVYKEYGADFWVEIVNSGFTKISISTLKDLSSIAICAEKDEEILFNKRIIVESFKEFFKVKE